MTKMTFNFDSRETYLAYRDDWRSQYRVISEEIRQTKRDIVTSRSKGFSNNVSSLQSDLHYSRLTANRLMQELEAAKEFKNEQLAALQPVAA